MSKIQASQNAYERVTKIRLRCAFPESDAGSVGMMRVVPALAERDKRDCCDVAAVVMGQLTLAFAGMAPGVD